MAKIKKNISAFVFAQRNRTLLALTFLLLLMVMLIIKYCDFPLLLPEKYFGFLICEPGTDKLWYNIGISYVAAYIFYIIQVYIPTYNEEQKSFKEIHRQLSGLIRSVKRIRYLLLNMYEQGEHGELILTESSVFFREKYLDSYKQSSDYTYTREMIQGKYVRKARGGCRTEAEFQKKLNEGKSNYERLMANKSLDHIDRNLYKVILEIDFGNYCDGIYNVISIMGKKNQIDAIVHDHSMNEIRRQIQDVLAGYPDFRLSEDNENFYVALGNGQRVVTKPKGSGANKPIPFHTGVWIADRKLLEAIARIESVCELDTDIMFEKMTDEEVKSFDNPELTKRIQNLF